MTGRSCSSTRSRPGKVIVPFVFLVSFLVSSFPSPVSAQAISQRGFVEARGALFPQDASNDTANGVGDILLREEAFAKPSAWIQFAVGFEARANSHNHVETAWRLDVRDRGLLRPALSIRRLSATLTRGPVTIDIGKQFIRWGKADVVTPTDRFAPRDFLNVVDTELLGVAGARLMFQRAAETIDAVWVPFFTPSRTPLLNQRWAAVPVAGLSLTFIDGSGPLPKGSQSGIRWGHTGSRYELSLSYFKGFNHLPNIDAGSGSAPFEINIVKQYPDLQSYGVDAAIPTRWLTIKGEAAYSTTSTSTADQYVVYVVQLERQTGEWLIVAGYAGEIVTLRRAGLTFAPDRGLTRSLVARASYTIDANRSAALETAVRQNGRGAYVKGEYSQARGQHWRATLTGAAIRGRSDDFLGQYRRNSHITLSLRYSF